MSSLPPGLNLNTWWPTFEAGAGGSGASGGAPRARRGALSWPSVTQMLPSRSTWKPCGKIIIPAPKWPISCPDGSKCRIGSSADPRQLFAPQRSPTQTERPSLSMPTALVDPHTRPSGILK